MFYLPEVCSYFVASLAAFRDSLLERYPCILDQFLQKAIEDDGTEVSLPLNPLNLMLNQSYGTFTYSTFNKLTGVVYPRMHRNPLVSSSG